MQPGETFSEVYLNQLKKSFSLRKAKNKSYSLRAYAKVLKLSPAQLSQVFSGKRRLTRESALKILENSGLSPLEKQTLSQSLLPPFQSGEGIEGEYLQIDSASFKIISSWRYYAVLNLCGFLEGKLSPVIVSRELNISPKEARSALKTLEELKLLKRVKGRYQITFTNLTTTQDIPDAGIRLAHRDILARAAASLDRDAMETQDYSYVTMAIDPTKIPSAKKMIRDFRRRLCRHLETGNQRAVYTMALQLFPVSKSQGEKNDNA